jgi:hypothetical protein
VLRGCRLVVPGALQSTVLKIAHEGHLGATKTKQLLRTKVWFNGMDQAVERMIRNCTGCILNSLKAERPPLQPTVMHKQVWDHLAVDFLGPLQNKHELLVIYD